MQVLYVARAMHGCDQFWITPRRDAAKSLLAGSTTMSSGHQRIGMLIRRDLVRNRHPCRIAIKHIVRQLGEYGTQFLPVGNRHCGRSFCDGRGEHDWHHCVFHIHDRIQTLQIYAGTVQSGIMGAGLTATIGQI